MVAEEARTSGERMNPTRIYIAAAGDRDAVVAVLARNGYTVRQGREKSGKSYKWFVEYYKED